MQLSFSRLAPTCCKGTCTHQCAHGCLSREHGIGPTNCALVRPPLTLTVTLIKTLMNVSVRHLNTSGYTQRLVFCCHQKILPQLKKKWPPALDTANQLILLWILVIDRRKSFQSICICPGFLFFVLFLFSVSVMQRPSGWWACFHSRNPQSISIFILHEYLIQYLVANHLF